MSNSAHSSTRWVAQSSERIAQINRRASDLIAISRRDHFRRLIQEWASADEGALPTWSEAEFAAQAEIEIVCRALGRLGALDPSEVFPSQPVVTTPLDEEGW